MKGPKISKDEADLLRPHITRLMDSIIESQERPTGDPMTLEQLDAERARIRHFIETNGKPPMDSLIEHGRQSRYRKEFMSELNRTVESRVTETLDRAFADSLRAQRRLTHRAFFERDSDRSYVVLRLDDKTVAGAMIARRKLEGKIMIETEHFQAAAAEIMMDSVIEDGFREES